MVRPAAPEDARGKFLALTGFVGLAIACSRSAVAASVAFALARSKGVDTSAWTSSTGIDDLGQTILHVYLASLGYGILGAALAVLPRSPALAVAIGVAYALPGEAVITRLWDRGGYWLPGQLLAALAHGGTTSST
jgi:uncharacterized membrane protein